MTVTFDSEDLSVTVDSDCKTINVTDVSDDEIWFLQMTVILGLGCFSWHWHWQLKVKVKHDNYSCPI